MQYQTILVLYYYITCSISFIITANKYFIVLLFLQVYSLIFYIILAT